MNDRSAQREGPPTVLNEARHANSRCTIRAESVWASIRDSLNDSHGKKTFGRCYTGLKKHFFNAWPDIEVYVDEIAKEVWSQAEEGTASRPLLEKTVRRHIVFSITDTTLHELVHHIGNQDFGKFSEDATVVLSRALLKQGHGLMKTDYPVPVLEAET